MRKNCKNCDKRFTIQSNSQLYCSVQCRELSYYGARKEKKNIAEEYNNDNHDKSNIICDCMDDNKKKLDKENDKWMNIFFIAVLALFLFIILFIGKDIISSFFR